MLNSQPSRVYKGVCHCGEVRFHVVIDRFEAIDCNCSICRKKGFLHLLVPPENFTLIKFDINVNCLDERGLLDFEIQAFDGQNWEKNVEQIRNSPVDN